MSKRAVVVGAGITGLAAGWKLAEAGYEVRVVDKNTYLGGMSSTFKYKDYSLDFGPHKVFTVMDHIMEEIQGLFADESLITIKKQSRIRLRGKYLNYPVGMKDIFASIGVVTGVNCGMGYAGSKLKMLFSSPTDESYEDWVVNRFGRPTFELVLGPYARKIWGNPRALSKDLAETRIAMPSLMEMVKQMIFGRNDQAPIISADYFYYPPKGFIQISQKMAARIEGCGGKIQLGVGMTVIETDVDGFIYKILFEDGSEQEVDHQDIVISTAPIPSLINSIKPLTKDGSIIAASKELNTRKLILLFVVIQKDRLTSDNWLFFPESSFRFNRVFEQKGFNRGMVPKDRTVLCAEITCGEDDPLWNASDEQIYAACKDNLGEAGLMNDEVIEYFVRRLDDAYPIYDLNYKKRLNFLMEYLDRIPNLYSIGRQGCYSYSGMADCMDMGISTASFITDKDNRRDMWNEYRQRFYDYVVVD